MDTKVELWARYGPPEDLNLGWEPVRKRVGYGGLRSEDHTGGFRKLHFSNNIEPDATTTCGSGALRDKAEGLVFVVTAECMLV